MGRLILRLPAPLGALKAMLSHAGIFWLCFTCGLCAGRTVDYTFEVSYFELDPDCNGKTWVQGVNGVLPGTPIVVRQHDRLRVEMVNRLQTEAVTLHLHGFEQRGSQEYDGVEGVTMCGIRPNSTFVFDLVVDEHPGTYLYHDHAHHLAHVGAFGLLGGVIVLPEEGTPELWQYDVDETVILFDWWQEGGAILELLKNAYATGPNTQSPDGNDVGLLEFNNILINGRGAWNAYGQSETATPGWINDCTSIMDLYTISPAAGETWRLRIANGGALYAMRFRIDGHRMRVIQTDAADVEEYVTDAIILSSGERYDVLVTFDKAPGSYWMRVETLEGWGLHHGQLGVVRYQGTPEGVEPTMGYPRTHKLTQATQLVTLNCMDQNMPYSSPLCRPITDLRRHPSVHVDVGTEDNIRQFEVNLRGFRGNNPGHFTRLIDGRNPYGSAQNQFDGEYVQFQLPKVPYAWTWPSYDAAHPNTVTVNVPHGANVRIVLQWRDRGAHPWHLHGHKFAVLEVGQPDYANDCSVIYCNAARWLNSENPYRDTARQLSDAPLKDTIHVPAGGWAVIQFKADNPGWWLFHCHMALHLHDGMGIVILEGEDMLPDHLVNVTSLSQRGFPSCQASLEKVEKHGAGLNCACYQNPEMKLDNMPRSTYRCSQPYLCDNVYSPLDPAPEDRVRRGVRARAAASELGGWRLNMCFGYIVWVIVILGVKYYLNHASAKNADYLHEAADIVELMEFGNFNSHQKRNRTWSTPGLRGNGNIAKESEGEFQSSGQPGSSSDATSGSHKEVRLMTSYTYGGESEGAAVSNGTTRYNKEGDSSPLSVVQPVATKALDTSPELVAKADINPPMPKEEEEPAGEEDTEVLGEHVEPSFKTDPDVATGSWLSRSVRKLWVVKQASLMSASPQDELANLKDHERTLARYEKSIEFTAENKAKNGVRGSLPAGSMCLLLGNASETKPWLRFFAGKVQHHIIGNIRIADVCLSEWTRYHLRLTRGYIGTLGINRPETTVYQNLNLVLELVERRGLYDTLAQKLFHLACFINMFKLYKWLNHRIKDLPEDVLMRLEIAKQTLLPRGLLVIKDPFTSLGYKAGLDLMGMLTKLRQVTGVTIIISACSFPPSFAKEKGRVTHMMVLAGAEKELVFGDMPTIKRYYEHSNKPLKTYKPGRVAMWQWCNDLIIDGGAAQAGTSTWHDLATGAAAGSPTMKGAMSLIGEDLGTNKYGLLHRVKSVLRKIEDPEHLATVPRKQRRFIHQCWILTCFEFRSGLSENVHLYKVAEITGLGVITGLVWYNKGSEETQTSLGETVGLLFFSTALWTVPQVFMGLSAAPGIISRATIEHFQGLYHINALVCGVVLSAIVTSATWAAVWQAIAYTIADVGRSPQDLLMMQLVLMLNMLAMRSIGWFLGLICPNAILNTVVGNLVAQLFMLTNGFYTELKPWLGDWVVYASVPRYSFKALLKLEYRWDDAFLEHPTRGVQSFGYPTKYIPAELTGIFQLLHQRDMDVMKSPEEKTVFWEVLSLLLFFLSFVFGFSIALLWRVRLIEERPSNYAQTIKVIRQGPWENSDRAKDFLGEPEHTDDEEEGAETVSEVSDLEDNSKSSGHFNHDCADGDRDWPGDVSAKEQRTFPIYAL